MRQMVVLACVLGSGCSLLYNPNNLPTPDAKIFDDAHPDTPLADADPSMMSVSDLQPPMIYEGQGLGNGRPAVLTVRGSNFVPGAVSVTIAPTNAGAMADLTLGTLVVAGDGNSLAVPVTANIMTAIGSDTAIPLTVSVTELGVTKTIAWSEIALDELKTSAQLASPADRYSQVNLGDTSLTNASNVIIHSMSDVILTKLHADSTGQTAGPGANGGGAAAGAGGGAGGGGSGAQAVVGSGGAGGGGGFAAMGGGANGGAITGNSLVPTYMDLTNRASGGGGGGATVIGNAGGPGGGGGGTLEVHAEGDLTANTITAVGGPGGTAAGGAGGGGAGGLVVIRAGHTLAVTTVNVSGGLGGGSSAANAGSVGRIRLDAATDVAGASLGPSFAIDTPVITTQHTINLSFRIPKLTPFTLQQLDQDGTLTQLGMPMSGTDAGTAAASVTLVNGWNKICLTVPGGSFTDDIANECVEIAFMTPPQT